MQGIDPGAARYYSSTAKAFQRARWLALAAIVAFTFGMPAIIYFCMAAK